MLLSREMTEGGDTFLTHQPLPGLEQLLTKGGRFPHDDAHRFLPNRHGINETAPYFHDHRAKTLEEVVRHYQSFFCFINVVRGFPLPLIPDEDVAPIVAYLKKAF